MSSQNNENDNHKTQFLGRSSGRLRSMALLIARCDAAPEKPNIIFLMDDQHRWDALGIVNPAVKTPNLDKLAENGIFYDQTVCQAPMCTPSRNSMMLGLYPNQLCVLRNGHTIPDDKLPSLPLAELFKNAGYQTAGFGKTHWGSAWTCSTIRNGRLHSALFTNGKKRPHSCGERNSTNLS